MLTLAQSRTLQFVVRFIREHDYAPTAQEIAHGIGIKSRGVVHRYLTALQTQGYVKLIPNRHRNIVVIKQPIKNGLLPLVGTIAAGQPIEAINEHEYLSPEQLFCGDNLFALRVKGDSMKDQGILDADVVVCRGANSANNGEVVVALIDHSDATLKRIQYHQNGWVSLHPANHEYQPLRIESKRVQIQGVFVGILRLPS